VGSQIFDTSTTDRTLPILDNDAKLQFDALEKNCRESGVRLFDMNSKNQGIVHIIGRNSASRSRGRRLFAVIATPQRTARFGTLAFGIGTSEVEHVLANTVSCPVALQDDAHSGARKRPKGSTAKDLIWPLSEKPACGRQRPCRRIRRRSHSLSFDGRADDRVQHDD